MLPPLLTGSIVYTQEHGRQIDSISLATGPAEQSLGRHFCLGQKFRRRSLHALGVAAVCYFSYETHNSGLLIPLFRHPETTRLRQSQSNRDSDAAVVEQIPNQKRFIPGDSAPSTSLPWAQPTLCRFCGGWHTNCAFLHIACLLSDVSLPSNPAATLRFGTFRSFPILRYLNNLSTLFRYESMITYMSTEGEPIYTLQFRRRQQRAASWAYGVAVRYIRSHRRCSSVNCSPSSVAMEL